VTVTAKIYTAATAPREAELARRCLGDDFTQRFRADTARPFDVTDYSTKLDVWTPYVLVLGSLKSSKPRGIEDWLAGLGFSSYSRRFIESATPVTTIDQALEVLRPSRVIDRMLIASILDSSFDNPKTDPLEGYEQYSEPNWDGHDAEPITAETLHYARWLLKVIPETFGPPDIAPSADGSIGLEWVPERGSLQKLFLDIGPGQDWRAYWKRRNDEFGRMPGGGFGLVTKLALKKLFNDLSR
jgi:hypothetical protein